jgi:hypothetical protein
VTDHEELADVLQRRALPTTGRSADGALLEAAVDARVLHLDETRAVEPPEAVQPTAADPPEAFSTGF